VRGAFRSRGVEVHSFGFGLELGLAAAGERHGNRMYALQASFVRSTTAKDLSPIGNGAGAERLISLRGTWSDIWGVKPY